MPSIGLAKALERFGIRSFYRLLTNIGNERMLEWDEEPNVTATKLKEMRDDVRYYSWANFFRGILYVPVIIVLWPRGVPAVTASLVFLVVFHAVCMLLEFYKGTLMDYWLPKMPPEGAAKADTIAATPYEVLPHWYFSGKPFESIAGYRAIGVELFRRGVVYYTNRTKYTKEELKAGKRVEYLQGGSMASVIKYERDTRVGELMHLGALSFNVAPFTVFVVAGQLGWSLYVGFILWLDLYLVLLQRYNRLRVHRIVMRARRPRASTELAEQTRA